MIHRPDPPVFCGGSSPQDVQRSASSGHALPLVFGVAAMLLGAPGCTRLSYRSAEGESFTRVSVGSRTAIGSLVLEATNGVRHLELRGYENDSAQAMGAVTEAAVRAALANAK